jgi:glycosyltransferase involved in cell wall biosynthesis
MQNINKKISIVIPVLNGEERLRDCLSSVCNQDTEVHEYIIVDNNSTDGTKTIIEEFQKKYVNMHYVFEATRTRGAARNAGIRKVSGDIIVMTDVDCVVSKDWVRAISEPILLRNEKVVCGGQYDLTNNYWSRHMQKMSDYFLKNAISPDGYVVFCDTKNFAVEARLMKRMMFDGRFKALENVELEYRMRPVSRVKYLKDLKVGHHHVATMLDVIKLSYSRAYWFGQIYHKFKGVGDKNGTLIFPVISAPLFYLKLFKINIHILKEQGIQHVLFFLVFDFAWKIGSAVGFAKIDNRFAPPLTTT